MVGCIENPQKLYIIYINIHKYCISDPLTPPPPPQKKTSYNNKTKNKNKKQLIVGSI